MTYASATVSEPEYPRWAASTRCPDVLRGDSEDNCAARPSLSGTCAAAGRQRNRPWETSRGPAGRAHSVGRSVHPLKATRGAVSCALRGIRLQRAQGAILPLVNCRCLRYACPPSRIQLPRYNSDDPYTTIL